MDIFISYAREDRNSAERLAGCLVERGWSVWWDREIVAGDNFASVIEDALTNARAVLVLWSRQSLASSWVRNEATEGERRHALVPVLIENGIEQPLAFRHLQAANLADWVGDTSDNDYRALVRALTTHTGSGSGAKEPTALPSSGPAPTGNSLEPAVYRASVSGPSRPHTRTLLMAGLLSGGFLVATIGVIVFFRGEHGSATDPQVGPSALSQSPPKSTQSNATLADRPVVQLWADAYDGSSERINNQERHPVSAAFDGNRQSAWNSLSSTEGKAEWIEAKFSEPVFVHHVIVYNGYQFLTTRGESLFFKNLRAKSLDVYADGASTPVAQAEFGRMDQTPVSISIRHKAQFLRFSVGATWSPEDSAIGKFRDVCISEIEIWGSRGL